MCISWFFEKYLAVHPQLSQFCHLHYSNLVPHPASLQQGQVESSHVSPVSSCSSPITCKDLAPGLSKLVGSTGAINVALQFLPFAVFRITGVHWTSNVNATFCKAVLNYCRHDGLPRQWNTSHGIQDVPFSYVSCRNIPVYILQIKMYYTLISNHIWCLSPVVACDWWYLVVRTSQGNTHVIVKCILIH
jgi:hypothetical protein